jgi:hydroxypyruvate reductase
MTKQTAKEFLNTLWRTALDAADPFDAVQAALPEKPAGRVVVIGAGKASARMAEAVESAWGPAEGLIVAPHGYGRSLAGISLVEAAHPVPDDASEKAAHAALALASGLGEQDTLVCLISGGGSALLSAPAGEISAADKRAVNQALLLSGAPIQEMNCVRKHLSRIKGGRLAAAAAPAQIITLAVSDVVGDDLSVIASGPTLADPTTITNAQEIISRYQIDVPESVRRHLQTDDETPKAADLATIRQQVHIVTKPSDVLAAVQSVGEGLDLNVVNLGDAIEGEAREVGKILAGIAASIRRHQMPVAAPALIISGGETTVTVRADGKPGSKGGRNTECALAFALATDDKDIHALMADTDGIDGRGSHAGAYVSPRTLEKIRAAGGDPRAFLAEHDSATAFDLAGGLITTGQTATNVNDFRAILVL